MISSMDPSVEHTQFAIRDKLTGKFVEQICIYYDGTVYLDFSKKPKFFRFKKTALNKIERINRYNANTKSPKIWDLEIVEFKITFAEMRQK